MIFRYDNLQAKVLLHTQHFSSHNAKSTMCIAIDKEKYKLLLVFELVNEQNTQNLCAKQFIEQTFQ